MTMTGFRLDGGNQSLVFVTPPTGAPRLGYWGPDLGELDLVDQVMALLPRALPGGMLDQGEALSWLPEPGQGFTGYPGLAGHRNGQTLISQLALVSAEAGRVVLQDDLAAIRLEIVLAVDPATGVLSSRTRLTNLDPVPLTLDWLAAGAFESPHAQMLMFDGRWTREFIPVRQTLTTGLLMKENRTGHTSHHAPPFMVAGEPGFGEQMGEVYGLHLAWSGDHRMFAERLRDGRIQIQAGELLHPGEVILARGETYDSPTLYLARSETGLNGLSDRLHPFVRDQIMAGRLRGSPRPVNYNTWEAVYFGHDPATLMGLADLAAEVGAERYVLDDGWFRGRPNDRSGLGDWSVDATKYPQGLKPLIDHVRSLGIAFGLWVEPEMANADSDLLRAHPDWILGIPGRIQPLGRGQYVLDLTRPEVFDNIRGQIEALLSEYEISYLKWDMNRDLTHALSAGRSAAHSQTLAVYRLMDGLKARYPNLEIESCSSGGGRADYEILKRTDRIWVSDCNDPVERQAIQRSFSIFFPPEVMGSHIGPAAAHTTARTASLAMRGLTALFGHMGMEADLRAFTPEERQQLSALIALHKVHRDLLHGGRLARLIHPDPSCLAFMVSNDTRALVSAAQVETPATSVLAHLRVPGLASEAQYDVRMISKAPRSARWIPPLLKGQTLRLSGAALGAAGLPLPVLRAGEAVVFELTRVIP